MSYSTKNKILVGAVLLLLLANIATITVFWLGKERQPLLLKEQPADYLVKELGFDAWQRDTFLLLVKEHRTQAETLRQEVKTAKDNFFKLLQAPALTDSEKITGAQNISRFTEKLDLITFNHFKKVRRLCNVDQQKKFDNIIDAVMRMTGGPGQGPGLQRPPGAPPGERRDGPPPPGMDEGPPPPR